MLGSLHFAKFLDLAATAPAPAPEPSVRASVGTLALIFIPACYCCRSFSSVFSLATADAPRK
jgi:hypothetical protein